MEAGLLSALTKVERVSLAGVSLSSEQASSLLVRINVMIKMLSRLWKSLQVRAAERSEKNVLQRLNLSGNSLSQVPPMVLAGLSNNIKPQCRRAVCLSFVVRQHLKSKSEIFFSYCTKKQCWSLQWNDFGSLKSCTEWKMQARDLYYIKSCCKW